MEFFIRQRLAPWLESDYKPDSNVKVADQIGSSDGNEEVHDQNDESASEDSDGSEDDDGNETDGDDEDDDYPEEHSILPHQLEGIVAVMNKATDVYRRHWPAMKAHSGQSSTINISTRSSRSSSSGIPKRKAQVHNPRNSVRGFTKRKSASRGRWSSI